VKCTYEVCYILPLFYVYLPILLGCTWYSVDRVKLLLFVFGGARASFVLK